MEIVRKSGLAGILVLLLVGTTGSAWAQVQTGSIFVKIVDDQGAAVPGATVTLTSPVLPRPIEGVTDSSGARRFSALTICTYTIKTVLTGFQSVNREGVVIVQNQTVSIDITMKVGSFAEAITVSASPVVDTKSASVATNLDAMLLDTTPAARTSGASSNTRSRASSSTSPTSAATRRACSVPSPRAARPTRRTCSWSTASTSAIPRRSASR